MNNHIHNPNIITYEDVKNNKEIQTYISSADEILGIAGYTKHDLGHGSTGNIFSYSCNWKPR